MKNNLEKINQTRRKYNSFVANETLEDYSLRYTPKSFRKWSEFTIANTAIGSISFLALEAIGASIAISYGFTTAFWAILTASIIIFLTAIPISYHAARYNIDIDLITRSAGFGYIGSTITSLIYASFSFIFFALEASIMAQAIKLYFGIPLSIGYIISSLVIIPLVFYGITFINKLQLLTQPIWLIMMIAPFVAVVLKEPSAVTNLVHLSGSISNSSDFNIYYFGFATGISLSLIAQIGEQVDYLRFMPPLTKQNKIKWWLSLLISGPGWIILGFLKQIGGAFLASLVIFSGMSIYKAKTPIEMYNVAYQYVFDNPQVALSAAVLFVIISQIKINITNAYAGSLAWSNFFSRVTHSHPGRVVWMVFNIIIAILLMELGLFDTLESVLGLYSSVAIAWISAITSDLLIIKPLGLSPKIIEFKRAYIYNINPVGVGSMTIASVIAIISFMGFFGDMAQSYSSLIAMFIAFFLAPIIAFITKGKYYIARKNELQISKQTHYNCLICDNKYEKEDMVHCPLHNGFICSLCCSLDSLCHDVCKKESESYLSKNIISIIKSIFSKKLSNENALRIFNFTLYTSLILFIVSVTSWMIYTYELKAIYANNVELVKHTLSTFFFIISILIIILVWWMLLNHENRILAEEELAEQNDILKKQQETLNHQAHHDALTGLPNRLFFNNNLSQVIEKATRHNYGLALLFIDLDRFKQINDSLGHHIGDILLQQVAQKLKDSVRKEDFVARLGGDEFTVLLDHIKNKNTITAVAKKVLDAIAKPFVIGEHTLYISSSIGISLYPKDDTNINNLMKYADSAMYQAKDKGRNNFQFYSTQMTKSAFEYITIEADLRKAIKNEEFIVYYQPQVDAIQKKIIGMEALIRWNHPSRGLLSPAKFIPIAQESDLIITIDEIVMKTAMNQFVLWCKQGLNPGILALNLTVKQLEKEGFLSTLKSIIHDSNCHPKCLELELTEGQIMKSPQNTAKLLQEISDLGIELAIDDFGTGYSSLFYLKKLPLTKLKIDQSFVRDLPNNEEDVAIAKAVIALAKSLNLNVIAEGVETQEQEDFLVANGCKNIQGYLHSKPIPAQDMQKLLEKNLQT